MTCVPGLPALAPTAKGRPTPIVPNGPELRRCPGSKVGIVWRRGAPLSAAAREFIAQVPNTTVDKPFDREHLKEVLAKVINA